MSRVLVALFLAPIAILLSPIFAVFLGVVFLVHYVLGPDGVLEARRKHLERCYRKEEVRR